LYSAVNRRRCARATTSVSPTTGAALGEPPVARIMRLQKRYPAARLERACARALHFRACSYKSVVAILRHRLDEEPLPTESGCPTMKGAGWVA